MEKIKQHLMGLLIFLIFLWTFWIFCLHQTFYLAINYIYLNISKNISAHHHFKKFIDILKFGGILLIVDIFLVHWSVLVILWFFWGITQNLHLKSVYLYTLLIWFKIKFSRFRCLLDFYLDAISFHKIFYFTSASFL